MSLIIALLLSILPSRMKCAIFRARGHDVGKNVYVGVSLIQVKKLVLKDNTYIGHGNVFRNLSKLVLNEGSRINRWNYFTGGSYRNSKLELGERASISMRHYFDVCDTISIGHDTIIAGIRSTFFTHSKGIDEVDYVKPITISNWCYVGSNICVLPGASIGANCFVGMGAVVTGNHTKDEYVLLAGNPAQVKKVLEKDSAYFLQGGIIHPHLRSTK